MDGLEVKYNYILAIDTSSISIQGNKVYFIQIFNLELDQNWLLKFNQGSHG